MEHTAFAMEASTIGDLIDEFLSNITAAESSFSGLQSRLDSSRGLYDNLQVGVALLERTIQVELRDLREEVRRLNQELETQVSVKSPSSGVGGQRKVYG